MIKQTSSPCCQIHTSHTFISQASPRAPIAVDAQPPPSANPSLSFNTAASQQPSNARATASAAAAAQAQPAATAAATAPQGPRPTPAVVNAPPLTNWLNATTGGVTSSAPAAAAEALGSKGATGFGVNKGLPSVAAPVPIQKPPSPAPPRYAYHQP